MDDFETHNLRLEVEELNKKLKIEKRKKIEAMGIADMMVKRLKSMNIALDFYSDKYKRKI